MVQSAAVTRDVMYAVILWFLTTPLNILQKVITIKLRIGWRISTILKTRNKSVWTNVFWYVKVCIFWKCIHCTMNWDKTQMLEKIPSDKTNGLTNALFFLSWGSTHHSFTFDLRFSYELEHKFCPSKILRRIFHFWFRSVFIKFIFLFNKMQELFDFKTL